MVTHKSAIFVSVVRFPSGSSRGLSPIPSYDHCQNQPIHYARIPDPLWQSVTPCRRSLRGNSLNSTPSADADAGATGVASPHAVAIAFTVAFTVAVDVPTSYHSPHVWHTCEL